MVSKRRQTGGYTLLELMAAIALIGVLAVTAVGSYQDYIERAEIDQAIKDIGIIQLQISAHGYNNKGVYPSSLAEIGLAGYEDPWGNPYQYLNIAQGGRGTPGRARKDRNLVPINSDFDLYSSGPDGRSVGPLTARHSRDDIIRANNGGFLGVAEDY